MAYTLQLRDIKRSSIRNIAGVCVDTDEFVQIVNEVTRRLMRRGGWWQTEVLMRLCLQGCKIVWPKVVGTVLGLRFCCSGEVPIRNNHWAIWGYRSHGWRGDAVVRDDGTRPCYNEIHDTTGKYIRANIVHIQDVGKTIRIFGFQFGNQPIEEQDSSGNWVPGLTLTLTQAGVQSTMLVTKITSVVKEETQGRVFLYEVDPTTSAVIDLAVYEANETNPAYRCSMIQNMNSLFARTDTYGRKIRQVEALVKLSFVPVVSDDDFCLLDNIEALKYGIQAFKLSEANDDGGAEAKTILAIRELNFQLRDAEPGIQTTIRVNSISSDCGIIANPI